jgi:hypothetical protein
MAPSQIDLNNLSEEELIELNHQVVKRIELFRQTRDHYTMLAFRVGERVRFHSSRGFLVTGLLTRLNRKTVTIVTQAGEQWNVAPGLLERLNDDGTVERITVTARPASGQR